MELERNLEIHDFFDNTERVKELARTTYLCEDIHGNEKFLYDVGDTVYAIGTGQFKRGVKIEIKERFTENGFCRYYGGGMWHRQKDITKEVI